MISETDLASLQVKCLLTWDLRHLIQRMYQYSYVYDYGNYAVQSIYDAYDVGVSLDYGTDDYSIGVWTSAENSAGYELALAYTGTKA